MVAQNCAPIRGDLKTALRLTTSAFKAYPFLDAHHRVEMLRSCCFLVAGDFIVQAAVEQTVPCVSYAVPGHEKPSEMKMVVCMLS